MSAISDVTSNPAPKQLDSSINGYDARSVILSVAGNIGCIYSPTFNHIINLIQQGCASFFAPSLYHRVADLSLVGMYVINPLLAAKVSHIASGALDFSKGEVFSGTVKLLYAAALMTASPQILVITIVANAVFVNYRDFSQNRSLFKHAFIMIPFTIVKSAVIYLQIPTLQDLHEAETMSAAKNLLIRDNACQP